MLFPTIMCGGIGSRLWPVSSPERPKQFLPLLEDRSLLEATLLRLEPMRLSAAEFAGGISWSHPTVICGEAHTGLARRILADFEGSGIIGEVEGRNTAAAAALAAYNALELGGEGAQVLLLPADHYIARPELLGSAIGSAISLSAGGFLVTFGVKPDRPETGYGYIERGEALEVGFRIARFVEKPDIERARSYLSGGRHHWNAGIFLYGARWFLEELARLRPQLARDAGLAWGGRDISGAVSIPEAGYWREVESVSIDYAIAEKTLSGAIIPVDMGWSDIGSWESVHQLLEKDGMGNVVSGRALLAGGSRGCHVRSETGRELVLLGVEDLVVIDTEGGLLVMDRSLSQDLGKLKLGGG